MHRRQRSRTWAFVAGVAVAALLAPAVVGTASAQPVEEAAPASVTVLTLNVFHQGRGYAGKFSDSGRAAAAVAQSIKTAAPSVKVVALQESDDEFSKKVAAELNNVLGQKSWTAYTPPIGDDGQKADTSILTWKPSDHRPGNGNPTFTHKRLQPSTKDSSVPAVLVDGVWYYSLHTQYEPYGPDYYCKKGGSAPSRESIEKALEVQKAQAEDLLKWARQIKEPQVIMGDFNSPSSNDWDEANKSSHCDKTFPYTPAVSTFLDAPAKWKDAYREANKTLKPEVDKTWSINPADSKYDKDFDPDWRSERIDFILTLDGKSADSLTAVHTTKSNVFGPSLTDMQKSPQGAAAGDSGTSNPAKNWVSDHKGVMAELRIG